MELISISLDRFICDDGSDSQRRHLIYGRFFDSVHIIVFSLASHGCPPKKQIAENIWIYATNSSSRLWYIRDAIRIARALIAKCRRPVVNTQDPFETGLVGCWLKRKYKLPFIVQIHTNISFRFFAQESILNFFRWIVSRYCIAQADRVRVVTHTLAKYIQEHCGVTSDRIDILPVYVDSEQLHAARPVFDVKQKYPGYTYYYLTVARLVVVKNIKMQLRVISRLTRVNPDVLLVIVGSGPQQVSLQKLVQRLGIEDNVKFEGWHFDTVSYFKTADCLLVSSHYEGYGRTIVEALACGMPVISTAVGVAPEVIENEKNGFLVEPKNEDEFFSACQKCLSLTFDPALISKSVPVIPPVESYLVRVVAFFGSQESITQ